MSMHFYIIIYIPGDNIIPLYTDSIWFIPILYSISTSPRCIGWMTQRLLFFAEPHWFSSRSVPDLTQRFASPQCVFQQLGIPTLLWETKVKTLMIVCQIVYACQTLYPLGCDDCIIKDTSRYTLQISAIRPLWSLCGLASLVSSPKELPTSLGPQNHEKWRFWTRNIWIHHP